MKLLGVRARFGGESSFWPWLIDGDQHAAEPTDDQAPRGREGARTKFDRPSSGSVRCSAPGPERSPPPMSLTSKGKTAAHVR